MAGVSKRPSRIALALLIWLLYADGSCSSFRVVSPLSGVGRVYSKDYTRQSSGLCENTKLTSRGHTKH